MESKDFQNHIAAKIDVDEAIKRISNIPGWWEITYNKNTEKENDKSFIKIFYYQMPYTTHSKKTIN